MDLNGVMAKYRAARENSPSRYLMIIRNERNLYITYRDGDRLYRAKYDFSGPVHVGRRIDMQAVAQERAKAGETVASMLAWTNAQTPQKAGVYDGNQGCRLFPDGYGHLESQRVASQLPAGFDSLSLPTLQRYGWPEIGSARSTHRLVPDDRLALDNGLLCIEEQHPVTDSRKGEVTETTRFYLNPARDFICQRRHEGSNDYAEEVTQYGRTIGGQWYPLQIDEFGYRQHIQPITATPTAVNLVSLDMDPVFPENIFKPDALLTRYASQIVSDQAARLPIRNAQPNAFQARVAGRVLAGETRQPIAGALVRVAVPAIDMRHARVPSWHITKESDMYETRTDPDGRFELLIPKKGAADTFSVDAMAPGYGTAAGTFHSGGNPHLHRMSFSGPLASLSSNLTILLPPARYMAGVVRDSTGAPAVGVRVDGQIDFERGSASVASTKTDERGRFEIFDFPLQRNPGETAQLFFTSPTAVSVTLSGLYDLSPERLASLQVTLPRGCKVTGVLHDADDRAAAGVTVEAVRGCTPGKSTTTDTHGRFELAGLKAGPIHLRAHAMDIDQKAVQPLCLTDRDQNVILKMTRIEIKGQLKPVRLFGMQLVDVTPQIQKAYDLDRVKGVLVLDPGPSSLRLNIGELRKGYCFWIIGDKEVSNLKEMAAELLRQLAPPWAGQPNHVPLPPRPVRVVYIKPGCTNTQYLALTEPDVAELRHVAEQLGVTTASSDR